MSKPSVELRVRLRRRVWISAAMFVGLALPAAAPASEPSRVIGEVASVYVSRNDTLLDVARRAGLGFAQIRTANPSIDPWLPKDGSRVLLPHQHVVPPITRGGIVINLAELRLYHYGDDEVIRSYPVSIGDEGKDTPLGRTRVVRKQRNPWWTPTASERAEDPALPARVAPGKDNPMGQFALYLGWPAYAIHGTNRPLSIGRRGSHGCVRMYPEDVAKLFARTKVGTSVTVIDQRAKVAWLDGQLYLEVHPDSRSIAALESDGPVPRGWPYNAAELVRSVIGLDRSLVDWHRVAVAGMEQTGVPVPVLRRRVEAIDPGQLANRGER